ncbi:DUF305 domain-containing protein [Cellulomonas sp. H30R-01]|uniref:DUF305 domain-containing protein n=1 Tax=Cellulomonas sp. H30R-01 TaxID=2704467 RepID=UPI00138B8BE9|nr:DUF305 domain-containing protein [Cellulomonas sp. H30R-01]QHT54939.1 DUF305 domain-containing protein [Cellulomonas sp. H30R-01]
MSTTVRRAACATAALTLAATLAACGGGAPAGTAPRPDRATTSTTQPLDARHDETDTWFAQMMVVHHEGAIEMAGLAVDRAATPEVRDLAQRIADAQGPEIALMSGWLAAWGEDAPGGTDHGGMDHGGMDMHGMGQDEAMGSLDGLDGVAFDRAFLDLMIAHHRGAVAMAETELAEGTHPDAMRLARTIVDDQTAEITEMQNLLATL